jgi:hypothetical protein
MGTNTCIAYNFIFFMGVNYVDEGIANSLLLPTGDLTT